MSNSMKICSATAKSFHANKHDEGKSLSAILRTNLGIPFVFCTFLRTNSNYTALSDRFYTRNETRLLRGTNCLQR